MVHSLTIEEVASPKTIGVEAAECDKRYSRQSNPGEIAVSASVTTTHLMMRGFSKKRNLHNAARSAHIEPPTYDGSLFEPSTKLMPGHDSEEKKIRAKTRNPLCAG